MSRHTHYWLETGIPHDLVFLNRLWQYRCSVCDKSKYYRSQPLNPEVPSAWDVYSEEVAKGNAHIVMSPPLQIRQESQTSEGERYKRLVKGQL